MLDDSTLSFVEKLCKFDQSYWSNDYISEIGQIQTPDSILSNNKILLQSDIRVLWAHWFISSFYDPYKKSNIHYPRLYAKILECVEKISTPETSSSNKQNLAKAIARRINKLKQEYSKRKRTVWTSDIKKNLLDLAGPNPRCWLTGHEFSEQALDYFSGKSSNFNMTTPPFVDYITPIGKKRNDLKIEIDHAFPFSSGGNHELDNLKLSCGWANRVKSNHVSIYDSNNKLNKIFHPEFGELLIPPQFWSLRTLAMSTGCRKCEKSKMETQLFVHYRFPDGQLNPLNLLVYCQKCHPLGSKRLVPAEKLKD